MSPPYAAAFAVLAAIRNATATPRILSGAVEIGVSAGSAPDASGVVDVLLPEQGPVDAGELVVIDQQDNISDPKDLSGFGECDVVAWTVPTSSKL
ncbi:MAG: hypothetical protein ACTMIV_15485 [Brevibacterium aurantiacum]